MVGFSWLRQKGLGRYKYCVDKDVPLPPSPVARGAGDAWKSPRSYFYPFEIMELGDSFFVPFGRERRDVVRNRVNASVCGHARATGRVYALRSVEGGLRVWLVTE